MTRTKSDICDSIGISFVQGRYGRSDLIFVANGQVLHCQISDIFTDDISNLLKLCAAILENRSEVANLLGEPGGHQLSIHPDSKQHHVMMLEISTLTAEGQAEALPLLSIRTKRRQLLTLLMTELCKLRHFQTEPAFQRSRPKFGYLETLSHLNSRWDADRRLGPSILK